MPIPCGKGVTTTGMETLHAPFVRLTRSSQIIQRFKCISSTVIQRIRMYQSANQDGVNAIACLRDCGACPVWDVCPWQILLLSIERPFSVLFRVYNGTQCFVTFDARDGIRAYAAGQFFCQSTFLYSTGCSILVFSFACFCSFCFGLQINLHHRMNPTSYAPYN